LDERVGDQSLQYLWQPVVFLSKTINKNSNDKCQPEEKGKE